MAQTNELTIERLDAAEVRRLEALSNEQQHGGGRPSPYPFDDLTPGHRFIVRNVTLQPFMSRSEAAPVQALNTWKKYRRRLGRPFYPVSCEWIDDSTVEFFVPYGAAHEVA